MSIDMSYEHITEAYALTKWKELLKPLITIWGYFLSPFVGLIFRSKAGNCGENIECTVKLAYSFGQTSLLLQPFSIKPLQIYMEILSLAKIIYRLKPKTVVEIGTAGGGTLFIFCRLASDDATIISIDLPGGPFGGGYPRRRIPLYKAFARHDQKLFLLQEDSHNLKTLHKVKKILDEDKLDFLFLDGDHRYEGVKKDFEMYGPLVRRGGIIAFHDIVQGPPEKVGGVPKFWREIKLNYEYREIVKDWKQGGYGVGVIFV